MDPRIISLEIVEADLEWMLKDAGEVHPAVRAWFWATLEEMCDDSSI